MGGLPRGYNLQTCCACGKKLLVNTDTDLCLLCELEALREQNTQLELQVSAYKRVRGALAQENIQLKTERQVLRIPQNGQAHQTQPSTAIPCNLFLGVFL